MLHHKQHLVVGLHACTQVGGEHKPERCSPPGQPQTGRRKKVSVTHTNGGIFSKSRSTKYLDGWEGVTLFPVHFLACF